MTSVIGIVPKEDAPQMRSDAEHLTYPQLSELFLKLQLILPVINSAEASSLFVLYE